MKKQKSDYPALRSEPSAPSILRFNSGSVNTKNIFFHLFNQKFALNPAVMARGLKKTAHRVMGGRRLNFRFKRVFLIF